MADSKKHILTYAGLKKYEDELQDSKIHRRQENRAGRSKRRMSRATCLENAGVMMAKADEQRALSCVSRSWKAKDWRGRT